MQAHIRTVVIILCAMSCLTSPGCKQEHPDPVIGVTNEYDERLEEARQEAIQRWPEFVDHLKNRKPNHAYAAKFGFESSDGEVEYCWVQVSSVSGNQITGTLDNIPVHRIGLKQGDTVTRSLDELQDWIVADGTNIIGGFSVPIVLEAQESAAGE